MIFISSLHGMLETVKESSSVFSEYYWISVLTTFLLPHHQEIWFLNTILMVSWWCCTSSTVHTTYGNLWQLLKKMVSTVIV